MKKQCIYLVAVAVLLSNFSVLSAQMVMTNAVIGEITLTFNSLFNALKKGDVNALKLMLPAEEYAQYKVLFEKNKEYPVFLRNFYQGAKLRIGEVHPVRNSTNDVIAEFIVEFSGGETTTTRMRLHGNQQSKWKIKKVLAGKTDQGEPFGEKQR